jgi:hypothetical protein
MNYAPNVKSANPIASAPLGPGHTVTLFGKIQAEGLIAYAFLLVVFDSKSKAPVCIISSEVNSSAATLGGGSHFLGVFDGNRHANFGSSDE